MPPLHHQAVGGLKYAGAYFGKAAPPMPRIFHGGRVRFRGLRLDALPRSNCVCRHPKKHKSTRIYDGRSVDFRPKRKSGASSRKEDYVLAWLVDFVYSTTDVLGVVLELKPSATLSALRRLERKGYIVRDEIPVYGRIVLPIWGITVTGLMSFLTPQQIETQKLRYHQKGRVALSSLQHEMDVQRVALFCERAEKYDSVYWTSNREFPWPSKRAIRAGLFIPMD